MLLCRLLSRRLIRRFLAMVLNNAPRRGARYRMMAYDVSCDAANSGSLYASLGNSKDRQQARCRHQ